MTPEEKLDELLFDLLGIIHEQGEAISLLLAQLLDPTPIDPARYAEMTEIARRTEEKIAFITDCLGWQPGEAGEGK